MTDFATLVVGADTSGLRAASGDLDRLTGKSGTAETATRRLGSAQVSAGAQARTFANQNRVAAGQVGNLTAQLNDIGVMLAAGQNPLQLAIQQGTQINQVFSQLGGGRQALRGIAQAFTSMISPLNLATLGVIAGTAALTQFAIEAFSAGDAATDFEDVLEGLQDTAEALEDAISRLALTNQELTETYTIGAGRARELIRASAELQAAAASEELRAQVGALEDVAGAYTSAIDSGRRYRNVLIRISEDFGVTKSEAAQLEAALEAVFFADDIDQSIASLENLNDLMGEYGISAAALPSEFRAALIEAIDLGLETDAARALVEELVEEAAKIGPSLSSGVTQMQDLTVATVTALAALDADILAGVQDANDAIARAQDRASRAARSSARTRNNEAREIERRLKAQEDALLRQVQQHVLIEESVKRTADFWTEVYEDVAENLRDVDEQLNGPGRDLSRTFVEGLTSGDLDSAFKELGRKAGGAFVDTLFSGQSLGATFTKAITGITTSVSQIGSAIGGVGGIAGGFSGLLGGIGGALSGVAGIVSAALPVIGGVLAAVNLIGSFSKTKVIGAGILGELGPETEAFNFTSKKKSSFFGLTSSKSTSRDPNIRATNVLSDAREAVLGEVEALAAGIGGSARDISEITQSFRIDTRDMDTEEVERVLTAEIEKYQDRISLAALGTRKFTQLGESYSDTLARLSGSLTTFNAVANLLGTQTLPETIRQAVKASDILESVGGANAFSAASDTYFSSFLSLDEQIKQLSAVLVQRAQDLGLNSTEIDTRGELTAFVNSRTSGPAGALTQAAAISLAPLVDQLERLRETSTSAAEAIADQEAAEAALNRERISAERFDLEGRILDLQSDTVALRLREVEAVDASNRALVEQIHMLEDQKTAAEEAARAHESQWDEWMRLTAEVWELQGNQAALRWWEREKTHEANRYLLEDIHNLEDALEAERVAQTKAEEVQALRLELLRLEGDEVEILAQQRAELLSDEARMVFDTIRATEAAIEAEESLAQARSDALSIVEGYQFATVYDARRARADALAGRDVFSDYRNPNAATVAELAALRGEVGTLSSTMRIIAANTAETAENTGNSVALAAVV